MSSGVRWKCVCSREADKGDAGETNLKRSCINTWPAFILSSFESSASIPIARECQGVGRVSGCLGVRSLGLLVVRELQIAVSDAATCLYRVHCCHCFYCCFCCYFCASTAAVDSLITLLPIVLLMSLQLLQFWELVMTMIANATHTV